MKSKSKESNGWILAIIFIVLILIFSNMNNDYDYTDTDDNDYEYSSRIFSVIASSENEVLDKKIKEFAKKENLKIDIVYDDTLKITKRCGYQIQFGCMLLIVIK